MKKNIFRLYVEKKDKFDVESINLKQDLKLTLGIEEISKLKIVNIYDIEGLDIEELKKAKNTVFSDPVVDNVYEEEFPIGKGAKFFVSEYLPGQYDQRADSSVQCVQILTGKSGIDIKTSKLFIVEGIQKDEDFKKIKDYCINDVDSREGSINKPNTLDLNFVEPKNVKILEGFIGLKEDELEELLKHEGLAMDIEDLKYCQAYFKKEHRNPTITEIKVIDTYWSDHCRHTTFNTEIKNVKIEETDLTKPIKEVYEDYLNSREFIHKDRDDKYQSLMDIATIGMKEALKRGMLQRLDKSEEINACSIKVEADVNGKPEEWLIMFKNETHNHPTEIEPFGGAATCLGGAIRDPLSGRAYVYQAMRVTGSADPRRKIEDTIKGKLPQKKITTEAAAGYSSYGNQIGVSTGFVDELYHEGYMAKRMEVGAVIGGVKASNVVREAPGKGDVVILLGGKTGRDGCGGATGSSKEHTEESIVECSSEVQKGNAPTERKIQRLFRNEEVCKMIKRCNDFGAGGVSVAVGELTDGLYIDLDKVPKKYEGLDGTEIAISESQERMAIVIDGKNLERFISLAEEENLEATKIADVTSNKTLEMYWCGDKIVDLKREFLDSNGVKKEIDVEVSSPKKEENYFTKCSNKYKNIKEAWLETLSNLNVCSKKGMVERFDNTVGASTVLMPFGGKYALTPSEGMVAKIPVLHGETTTATIMSHGFNPYISEWSPFHGALYAVLESIAKIVALGGDYKDIHLSFQEYFESLGEDKTKWGKPFAALLGALKAQKEFKAFAIGGKDSMSGTFKELDVPPTLISFALGLLNTNNSISQEFKEINSNVVILKVDRDENYIPNLDMAKKNFEVVHSLIKSGKALSTYTIKAGGIIEAISKMVFGNKIGISFDNNKEWTVEELLDPSYGSIIVELNKDINLEEELKGSNWELLGKTIEEQCFKVKDEVIKIDEALESWIKPLETVFPTKIEDIKEDINNINFQKDNKNISIIKNIKPQVFIPAFPGTNSEYDTAKAFIKAGGQVSSLVFRNNSIKDIEETIDAYAKEIRNSNILAIPGGFSAGDEPDGSGKFIATVFRNEKIKDAVMDLIKNRDGLILGICNGFQALIKLGLIPYGEIRELDEKSPTLAQNKIGRHVSKIVRTKVVSNLSPWFNNVKVGDVFSLPISHGEGRFMADEDVLRKLIDNGQIASQYVDLNGNATYDIEFNPNGSLYAVEALTSPDGRILGKMAHSERIGEGLYRNIPGEKDQKIFEAGINYFK
ncbi:MAG: phosphoribosylformylglycinamidine synthase [Clostridium cochlearium]|uniref:phosphoribosylformylglycinamidine synthase n=1 Tax=Clostridium cochlearium TaxID=1494 RepID=UPI00280AB25D|nr:phosphoribosylformylglycinamidine synthase [Clostridium cochlearium]MDU1442480.1 phosphoribosylformylglycinamidine synthase [Clostridium cochlearium]